MDRLCFIGRQRASGKGGGGGELKPTEKPHHQGASIPQTQVKASISPHQPALAAITLLEWQQLGCQCISREKNTCFRIFSS